MAEKFATISIASAARWVAIACASDGVIAPAERRVLVKFARKCGIEPYKLIRQAYAISKRFENQVELVVPDRRVGKKTEYPALDEQPYKVVATYSDMPEMLEDVTEAPVDRVVERSMRTKSELYHDLRMQSNKLIDSRQRSAKGSNRFKDKISVLVDDAKGKRYIQESTNSKTLARLFQEIGYEKVAEIGMCVRGLRFPVESPVLVKHPKDNSRYFEATMGWYVISDVPTSIIAKAINYIGDKMKRNIVAEVITR